MKPAASVSELARFVTSNFESLGDPARAAQMAAYMKTTQPFHGVPTPARAPILKEMRKRFPPIDRKSYERGVLALWTLPHREEQYAAIAYARQHPEFVAPASLALYERMIREGA